MSSQPIQSFTLPMAQPRLSSARILKAMTILAMVELVLAVLIIVIGAVSTGLSVEYNYVTRHYYRYDGHTESYKRPLMPHWQDGSPFWGGIVILLSSAFGIIAARRPAFKCGRITALILVIVSAVISFIIVTFGCIWSIERGFAVLSRDNTSMFALHAFMVACNAFIAFCGLICGIMCIVSASLWCYAYAQCCGDGGTGVGQILYVNREDPPYGDQERVGMTMAMELLAVISLQRAICDSMQRPSSLPQDSGSTRPSSDRYKPHGKFTETHGMKQ